MTHEFSNVCPFNLKKAIPCINICEEDSMKFIYLKSEITTTDLIRIGEKKSGLVRSMKYNKRQENKVERQEFTIWLERRKSGGERSKIKDQYRK